MQNKLLIKLLCLLVFIQTAFSYKGTAQKSESASAVLEDALSAVVTVGVFETDFAKKSLGFRGAPSDMAYTKMLDLTGATGSGSGFLIRHNNKTLIITNAHVIEEAADKEGSIYVYTINRSKYKARVLGGDSFYDLAVLEFIDQPGSEVSFLEIREAPARIAEPVYAIGNPLGEYPYSVSEGIISAKNRVRGGLTGKFGFLQTTATVIWGNSGGPLVDAAGKVLGINSQIAFANQGTTSIWQPQINFALESPIAQRLINDIISNNGMVTRSYLGLELMQKKLPYAPGTREYAYYSKQYGVDSFPVINKIIEGSPASVLQPYVGYNLVAIGGEEVRNLEEALGKFEETKPNQKIIFTVRKNGQTSNVAVYTKALSRSGSASLGNLFLKLSNAAYTQEEQVLSLQFNKGGEKGTGLSFSATKNASKDNDEVLLKGQWQVLGIGLFEEGSESMWRVNDIADVGTAARLSGMTGVIDIALFKLGSDVEVTENYKMKRVMISGNSNVLQQTLWY
jgi:S1-C subfamily serine protease